MNTNPGVNKFRIFLTNHAVTLIFLLLVLVGIPLSGFSSDYLIQEMLLRISRDSFLVLSLLIPIMAGMGLNFGMILGSMAGQLGLIFITDWGVTGLSGLMLAAIIGTPFALLLGYMCGAILNKAKGKEMVTSYILGFFVNGLYQFFGLYLMGKLIPIQKQALLISRGYGIRNSVNLLGIRGALDRLIDIRVGNISIPVATYLVIGVFCLILIWFQKTKLGQNMRAVGQNMAVAQLSGIKVERTRIIAIIISTLTACYGQIIFLQNLGTMSTYTSHEQAGTFAIAALLVGGATVKKASLANVFVGVILFHMMFVISPMAGKHLIGSAQLGEYFRVFISYGIIAIALVLHAWKSYRERERSRSSLRGIDEPVGGNGNV
ncbi:ABC transporter permease [Aminivibrio sp.]